MPLFGLDHLQLTYRPFTAKKMETSKTEKAILKAELAFLYEIQTCSASKVVYWVVLVWQNSQILKRKIEKTKKSLKI